LSKEKNLDFRERDGVRVLVTKNGAGSGVGGAPRFPKTGKEDLPKASWGAKKEA